MAWLHPEWETLKSVVIKKYPKLDFETDNSRPISLTSLLLKLVERIISRRLLAFVIDRNALSTCKIGFRSSCSISFAHIDMEYKIRLAKLSRSPSALVYLDLAKAVI